MTQEAYPYIVDIQNSLISDIATKIVIPLGKQSHFRHESMNKLILIVEYENEQFVLLTPQIASIPSTSLQNLIGSIESMRDEIIAAIDFAITGI